MKHLQNEESFSYSSKRKFTPYLNGSIKRKITKMKKKIFVHLGNDTSE